jgi:diguanylate cyclase (GGDEF)-like protein
MAKSHLQKQSLLQKALLDKKVLTQEVLMYQRLMQIMRNENTFEDILKIILASITKGLGFDRAGIFLANWDRRMIERVIGIDQHGNHEWTGQEFPLDSPKGTSDFSDIIHGRIRWKFTNNIRRKVSKEMYEKYYAGAVTCAVQVPIMVDSDRIIGIIAADNLFTHRRLGKAELFSLLNFATQTGMAIESFRLHQQIRDLTIKDGLTGIYNRRYFDNYLPREVLRCRRYKRFLSLLYLDLDHFKNINDLYGHPAGDVVLTHVADRLILGLRNVDIVVRMGGDEFAVILPEVGPDGAKNVAERLFKSITEFPAPLELLGLQGRNIGVSIGIACLTESTVDYKELVRRADESLYQAKTAGRNRVGDLFINDNNRMVL